MNNLDAVLTSAIVAALVTLGIEFAAKPRLEARKIRILDAHQRRRDLVDALRELLRCSRRAAARDQVIVSPPPQTRPADLPRMQADHEQAFADLGAAAEAVSKQLGHVELVRQDDCHAAEVFARSGRGLSISRGVDPEWAVDGWAPDSLAALIERTQMARWKLWTPAGKAATRSVRRWVDLSAERRAQASVLVTTQAK